MIFNYTFIYNLNVYLPTELWWLIQNYLNFQDWTSFIITCKLFNSIPSDIQQRRHRAQLCRQIKITGDLRRKSIVSKGRQWLGLILANEEDFDVVLDFMRRIYYRVPVNGMNIQLWSGGRNDGQALLREILLNILSKNNISGHLMYNEHIFPTPIPKSSLICCIDGQSSFIFNHNCYMIIENESTNPKAIRFIDYSRGIVLPECPDLLESLIYCE